MAKRTEKASKRKGKAQAELRIAAAIQRDAETLNISGLGLTSLPEAIFNLTAIKQLRLSANQLTALSESIGCFSTLNELHLNSNSLRALPEAIGRLTSLKQISLSNNRLTTLPKAIGRLTSLRQLFMSGNEFAELPEAIRGLTGLRELDLANNKITGLPNAIDELTELRELNLANNQITDLPAELSRLARLRALYLHGNTGINLPAEVLGPTFDEVRKGATPAKPAEILAYYFRSQAGAHPLMEAKLILVGQGGVGKTSLVNRLLHDSFDPQEAKTEGIATADWEVELPDGQTARLHVWDFGGQEIMHATHQFFLTTRSVYLLALNSRKGYEDEDAYDWLSRLDSISEDSPVVIVLNKIKEQPFALDYPALQKRFPAIHSWVETDCSDGTGIDELLNLIADATNSLPHLRDSFPADWFTIKDRLADMEDNFISFSEFRQMCAQHGETDPVAQEQLAGYLHSLGIALSYKDDPRLRDTNVLNPRWVTNGIYGIINHPKLAERQGEIAVEDLVEMLDPQEYPAERQPFLLELMRRFELCFRFPGDDDRFLIPQLLSSERPSETNNFSAVDCLAFAYQYETLLPGLLPRFIVRSYVLSEGRTRWRTGVILGFEGNTALVNVDKLARRVEVRVAGPMAGRRRLLSVIRADFEAIHRDYAASPEALVPVPDHSKIFVKYATLRLFEQQRREVYSFDHLGDIIDVDVRAALDGVEPAAERQVADTGEKSGLRIFYSYSHKDEALRDELETHLKLFQRAGLIESWHDRQITAGIEWKGEIDENLERADIILLLISADFLASDYCFDVEWRRAYERYRDGSARVVPIIVRDVKWTSKLCDDLFSGMQALPKDGRAVTTWSDRDTAWRSVAEGLERVIGTLPGFRSDRRTFSVAG
jgi:internalin A